MAWYNFVFLGVIAASALSCGFLSQFDDDADHPAFRIGLEISYIVGGFCFVALALQWLEWVQALMRSTV